MVVSMSKTRRGPHNPKPSAFGRVLKRVRSAKGLTQEQVDERCQFHSARTSAYESGGSLNPPWDVFLAYANALEIDVKELDALVREEKAAEGVPTEQVRLAKLEEAFDDLKAVLRSVLDRMIMAESRLERLYQRDTHPQKKVPHHA
jgi:transcriptional regulator with XRE-family HTH domain